MVGCACTALRIEPLQCKLHNYFGRNGAIECKCASFYFSLSVLIVIIVSNTRYIFADFNLTTNEI